MLLLFDINRGREVTETSKNKIYDVSEKGSKRIKLIVNNATNVSNISIGSL